MRLTRRSFLVRTSAGAAAIGALTVAPAILGRQSTAEAAAAHDSAGVSSQTGAGAPNRTPAEPIVAHVRDAARGEIAIYAGTREIIIRDPALVSTLLRAL